MRQFLPNPVRTLSSRHASGLSPKKPTKHKAGSASYGTAREREELEREKSRLLLDERLHLFDQHVEQ